MMHVMIQKTPYRALPEGMWESEKFRNLVKASALKTYYYFTR